MNIKKLGAELARKLRKRAEETIKKKEADSIGLIDELSAQETKKLLHELLVHQTELELQNEELCNIMNELEISQARYSDLFNQAPVGYICLDEDGLILENNLTAATLFGTAASEMKNQLLSHYIFPADQDIFYFYRKSLFDSGLSQQCELRMKRKIQASDDAVFWARLESRVADPVSIASEKQPQNNRCCRIVISDVTENRKLSEQLHQAQKMETIGLLAGGVAHDFNNKLAVIIGYAELALSKDVSQQSARIFFEEILAAAQHSATITQQLLSFARKQMVFPVLLDLNLAISEMLNMLKQAIGEEIELVWQPEANLFPVKIDPVQIDQIVLNLCLNAKAAIARHGKITIATRNAIFDPSFCKKNEAYLKGEFVNITVRDTGCGMSEEILAKIFDPFFTTREVGKGTGLGMSAIDGIVKQNKGFIKINSKLGAGTEVQVYLPVHRETNISSQSKKQIHKKMPLGHGKTILVVENETALLPIMRMMLEELGFRVLTAESTVATLNLVRKHQHEIGLLITDVIMPENNGCEVAGLVKKSIPDIKTIYMSGHPANVLKPLGFSDKNVSFLQKPFSLNDLADKIREVCAPSEYSENDVDF